ncbi:MAG: ATP phosphoribosyltransferase regulatory subunit [Clostridia bacterium]|nr:ATP phosphoribosyltransferase regulatory subunit [Clostridia bacterium]MBR3809276.1 ATP phosphoribosyltransferase regulatory subunit [Clostridia bacterium]
MNFQSDIIRGDEKAVFSLRSLYSSFGFKQFRMSKFEEYDLYVKNKDFLVSNEVITFTDGSGKLLALKPDVTLSIIKNSKDCGEKIQKVYYDENVYRTTKGNKEFREIMQTGLECIGNIGTYEVAEVVLLALKSLEEITDDFILDISYMDIILSVLSDAGLDSQQNQKILKAIGEKNTDEIKKICAEEKIDADRIVSLVTINGKYENVIEKLEKLCVTYNEKAHLKTFKEILTFLCDSGYADKINIDFSIVNNMNYYNGVVFQGYVNKIPSSILSGGQYDNLMLKMNRKDKAIGFAVYLDLLQRFNNTDKEYDVDYVLLKNDTDDIFVISKCVSELKKENSSVLVQNEIPENIKYRKAFKITAERVEEI